MRAPIRLVVRVVLAILVLAFVVQNLRMMTYYTTGTLDRAGTTITELPLWTDSRAVAQLDGLRQTLLADDRDKSVISTAFDSVSTKFEASSLIGTPLFLFSQDLGPFDLTGDRNLDDFWSRLLHEQRFRASMTDAIETHNRFYSSRFKFLDETRPGKPPFDDFFLDPRLVRAALDPSSTLLLESFNWSLFNHWTTPGQIDPTFRLEPYGSVHDLLAYVPSKRSPRSETVWRFEDDYFDRQKHWEAVGRYILFNVVNPSRRFRMELDVTTTTMGNGRTTIPPASVLGSTRVRFPGTGHYGAARLFSPPLSAQVVNGLSFIELDMGRDGKQFLDRREGIMTLWGTEYPFDYRKITAFIRDISLISDESYRSLRAPEAIDFPKGLEDPNLEFYGLYEDGWFADRGMVRLSSPKRRQTTLRLTAVVPIEAFNGPPLSVTLSVDGRTVVRSRMYQPPPSGDLEMSARMPGDGHRHDITITAGPIFQLPHGDDRPATIRLVHLGFE